VEYLHNIKSPIGTLTLASDGENISGLWIEGQKYFKGTLEKEVLERDLPVFESAREWLNIYFSGREPDFLPPLRPRGSPFQRAIWGALVKIPYGKTTSYGKLAEQYEFENGGKRGSPRAVGGAVGHNPVSILIPCHRVIGKNGSLTGYAGGVKIKLELLRLEGAGVPRPV
jgi:methylated-DNA-[protein]-cysteine S-methyltransferase